MTLKGLLKSKKFCIGINVSKDFSALKYLWQPAHIMNKNAFVAKGSQKMQR